MWALSLDKFIFLIYNVFSVYVKILLFSKGAGIFSAGFTLKYLPVETDILIILIQHFILASGVLFFSNTNPAAR